MYGKSLAFVLDMSKIYETPPILDKTIPQKHVQIITRKPGNNYLT